MGENTEETFSNETTQGSPMSLLFALAAMAVLGAATFWFVSQRPLAQKILVDEETRSVIFTTEYRTGPQADRLSWDNIVKLQHVTTAAGNFENCRDHNGCGEGSDSEVFRASLDWHG